MATYTIELRKVCDIYGRDEVENWFKSYKLDDFLMPVQIEQINKFSVWSKDKLAKKIVDHYYMREIGFETPALFRHYAKLTMNEIMEKYLLLIYTKFLEYDPLSSVDYDETYERRVTGNAEASGTSNSNSSSNASGLNIASDTPEGQINKDKILNGEYASNTNASETQSKIQDETTTSQNSNSEQVETYIHHMEGDNGVIVTNQYLIREFRELAENFDMQIIQDLGKLFMGIY